jgi:DNA-binding LacI/PurR family transcriptional regulator
VTIKEIAAMCGVSTQTVSRVINRRPDVSADTRRAVEAAITSVGFQPSAVARSLVQRRSYTLGVIAAGLRFYGVSQALNGITEESEASGYALLLKELRSFQPPDIVPVVDFLSAHRVEGIIFDGAQLETSAQAIQELLPASCPPIVFLKCEPSPSYTTIGIDNYGGQLALTQHVISLGRRRIGYISGPRERLEARQRVEAFLGAIDAAGLQPGPIVEGNWSSASGEVALAELLSRRPDLDAVVAANDQMALGVLHGASLRGIRIPDDIAVVGFDALPESAQFTPSLTTAAQPLRELGITAVRELLAQIRGEPGARGRAITLPTQLIVRDSAPAPSRAQGADSPSASAPGPGVTTNPTAAPG